MLDVRSKRLHQRIIDHLMSQSDSTLPRIWRGSQRYTFYFQIKFKDEQWHCEGEAKVPSSKHHPTKFLIIFLSHHAVICLPFWPDIAQKEEKRLHRPIEYLMKMEIFVGRSLEPAKFLIRIERLQDFDVSTVDIKSASKANYDFPGAESFSAGFSILSFSYATEDFSLSSVGRLHFYFTGRSR